MTTGGTMRDGVIVLDEVLRVPDGTRVRIEVVERTESVAPTDPSFSEAFAALRGAIKGPEDFAEQLDHYRLGTPKR